MDDLQSLRDRITTLEQLLENSRAAAVQMLDERDAARVELEGALEQIKDLQWKLERAKALGIASTEGDNLAAIRKMASAGEPLIDIHAKRDAKGYPVDGS